MSDQPSTSSAPDPPQLIPPLRFRRRPTNLLSANLPDEEEQADDAVRILRPSEIPQRLPLAEYNEPEERKILPRHVPPEEIERLVPNDARAVVIPNDIPAEELIHQATLLDEVVSFRSTNYVEPGTVRVVPSVEPTLKFIRRNRHYLNRKVNGCTAFARSEKKTIWDVIVEAPIPSIYEGSVLFIEVHFDERNANQVPAVKFKTLIFHPSLGRCGDYDMRPLIPKWGSRVTMDVLYDYLISDMRDLKEIIYKKSLQEIEDMAQPNIARLAAGNWGRFEATARELARKMAGAHVVTTGTTSDSVPMPTFTEREGFARAPSPDVDVVGL